MTDAPAIYPALVAVQAALGKVAKDGTGPSAQGSYPFMRVDTIVERLQPLLAEHGIAVIPNQSDAEQVTYRFPKVNMKQEPIFDGRPDAVQIITRILYTFTFIAIADGSQVTAAAYGESIDQGDKGIRRAATAAWKEVLLRTFMVVAGDEDPDAFDPNAQPAQTVKDDRGEQARQKAAAGTGAEKAKRAPRTPRAAPPIAEPDGAVTPAAEPAAGTNNEDPENPEPQPEPEAGPAPAEFRVDPADVAHAEATAPAAEPARSPGRRAAAPVAAAPVETPAAREPEAPLVKPEPTTQDEKRYESVTEIRKAIRTSLEAIGKDRDYANEIGDRITAKPRGQWFANLNDLHAVLREIQSQAPAEDEGGF